MCYECGADAPFSKRIVADQSVELVGGAESYVASCRSCFGRALPLPTLPPAEAEDSVAAALAGEEARERRSSSGANPSDGASSQLPLPRIVATPGAVEVPRARQSSNPQSDSPPPQPVVATLFAATPSASGSQPLSARRSASPVEALRLQAKQQEAQRSAAGSGFAHRMRTL